MCVSQKSLHLNVQIDYDQSKYAAHTTDLAQRKGRGNPRMHVTEFRVELTLDIWVTRYGMRLSDKPHPCLRRKQPRREILHGSRGANKKKQS